MPAESIQRQFNHPIQRTGLLEQMSRVGHNGNVDRSGQSRGRSLVQIQHLEVAATDYEQRWGTNSLERVSGEIRATASRDHQPNMIRCFRGGDKRGRCASAGAEQGKRHAGGFGTLAQPTNCTAQPRRQPRNVEAEFPCSAVDLILLRSEQIHQERCIPCLVQPFRDHPIPRTVPAAATAVREEDNTCRIGRHHQVAVQDHSSSRYPNRALKITCHESSVPPLVAASHWHFAAAYGCGGPAGGHDVTALAYDVAW